jgi:hypothetical protein
MFASRRRFLQFRLKTLLVFMLVTGAACGWFAAKLQRKWRERAAVADIEKVGGRIVYDWQLDASINDFTAPGPAWLRRRLGDDCFSNVVSVTIDGWGTPAGDEVTGEWLRRLEPFTELTQATFIGTHVTDDGLRYVAKCRKIVQLSLTDETVTDAGLAYLRDLPAIKELDLSSASGVTDAGLIDIARLKGLEQLVLDGTSVTGNGIVHLQALPKLKLLYLRNTPMTDAGLSYLNGVSGLQNLHLDGTGITDAGLGCISGLSDLSELSLQQTAVTDAGLIHLRLPKLRLLAVSKTSVTIEGAAQLQAALPNCQVNGYGWSRPPNRP